MDHAVKARPVWARLFQKQFDEAALTRSTLRPALLLLISAQLGLVLLVMHVFRIEEQFGLLRLTPLIFGGFLVHALLPLRYRPLFFLVLSLGAIATVLGLKQGLGVIGIGLGLIGICHLPVAFAVRIGLLLGAAALLAVVRAGWIETGWLSLPTLVIPVLGAMFMFRLIIYLYDLRHEKKPATLWERLSYFFMLPNVCFLLFPVVDYQTYRRTYYDSDTAAIYQKGILWMYRGIVHLLLYRLVYYHLIPDPTDVVSLGGVVQAILTTYLLYLRISGQFHLIIGIMALFGFNLPETHHLYYLASSFNDYWRRINIYWKDFMMKIFYYPSFMKLRTAGTMPALAGATLIVFFGTWVLHSYQWFWLQGTFPLTGPDALFWGILGGLVVVNSLIEAKRSSKRKRLSKSTTWDARAALVLSAKTVGMFVFISVLWSLWSSASVGEWAALMAQAGNSSATAFGLLLAGLVALVGLGVLLHYAAHRGWPLTLTGSQPSFARSAVVCSTGTVLLLALGMPPVYQRLGNETATLVASIQTEQLNQQDQERMERGYYEGLLNAEKYTSALAHNTVGRPNWPGSRDAEFVRQTNDVLEYELTPHYVGTYKEAPFQVNQWGMRDKAYAQEKPPGTYRMALIGASYELGGGVTNEEIFEALVEDQLNANHADGRFASYEILNFSVGGYAAVQYVAVAEKAWTFAPDAVLYVAHAADWGRLAIYLRSMLQAGVAIPYPEIQEIVARMELDPGMDRAELERRMDPFLTDIIRWSLGEIAAACRERGVVPALLYVPLTSENVTVNQARHALFTQWAEEFGFVMLSLEDAFQGHEMEALRLAAWDTHPNVLGHQLLADRMYDVLVEHDAHLGLELSPRPEPVSLTP